MFFKPNVKNNHWCKQSFPLRSIPPNLVLALSPSSMIINGSQKVDGSLGLPNCVKNLLWWEHGIVVKVCTFIHWLIISKHVAFYLITKMYSSNIIVAKAHSPLDNYTKIISINYIVKLPRIHNLVCYNIPPPCTKMVILNVDTQH